VAFIGRRGYLRGMRRDRCTELGPLLLLLLLTAAPSAQAAAKKPAPAKHAAEPAPTQRLGTIDAWSAFLYKEKTGKVCYLAAEPQKSEPGNVKRKQPMAMVTHRPDENVTNVVSFVAGFPLKEGSDVALDIDGAKFDLFTKDDTAWARTSDLDKTIVEAMVKGKTAVAKGTPAKGAATADTYSLAGFTQALGLIDKACGVKR
jgi:hypothetical protein